MWMLTWFVFLGAHTESEVFSGFKCTLLAKCPTFRALAEQYPYDEDALALIKFSHCGYENYLQKVWCATFENIPEGFTVSVPVTSVEPTAPTISPPVSLPMQGKCGYQSDNKIIGGELTELTEFPWLALLQRKRGNKGLRGYCGGALINNRYVLTAAHCTRRGPEKIVLGEYDLRTDKDCVEEPLTKSLDCAPEPQTIEVESVHKHPEWRVKKGRPFYNDIALIRLAKPVTFTSYIQPICLPKHDFSVNSTTVLIASGWGIMDTEGNRSNVKRKILLPLYDSQKCTDTLKRTIKDEQLCAGGELGKDTCKGDSGGPLMTIDLSTGMWSVTGIVSLGFKRCGEDGFPAIYTYVPKYLDWIYSVIKT